jgi:hypothetical protein
VESVEFRHDLREQIFQRSRVVANDEEVIEVADNRLKGTEEVCCGV